MVDRRAQGRGDGRDPHQEPTYLRALYERQRSASATAERSASVKHSILGAISHILTNGELYREAGTNYFAQRDPQRATKRHVAQVGRLGHPVTIQEAAAA